MSSATPGGPTSDTVVTPAGATPLGNINSQQILEAFKSTNPEVYKKLMQVAEQTGNGPDLTQLATLLASYPSALTFPPPAPMALGPDAGPSSVHVGQSAPGNGPPGGSDGEDDDDEDRGVLHGGPPQTPTGGRRGGRNPAMGTEEWARQRKDNHKEVERRRRGNINDGINELGRIVPSGSGEKSKGAILSRAVQYIHHLKENESRNIEKWTLEKLLMDQAMGDLQAQLEEIRRLWESERMARLDLENEVRRLKGNAAAAAAAAAASAVSSSAVGGEGDGTTTMDGSSGATSTAQKRASSDEDIGGDPEKRQRTE